MLRPYVNQLKVLKEQPIILVGVDNSSSLVAQSDSSYYKGEFIQQLNNFQEEFEDDFQVELYAFGEQVERNPKFDFKDRKTNLSDYFKKFQMFIPIEMWLLMLLLQMEYIILEVIHCILITLLMHLFTLLY